MNLAKEFLILLLLIDSLFPVIASASSRVLPVESKGSQSWFSLLNLRVTLHVVSSDADDSATLLYRTKEDSVDSSPPTATYSEKKQLDCGIGEKCKEQSSAEKIAEKSSLEGELQYEEGEKKQEERVITSEKNSAKKPIAVDEARQSTALNVPYARDSSTSESPVFEDRSGDDTSANTADFGRLVSHEEILSENKSVWLTAETTASTSVPSIGHMDVETTLLPLPVTKLTAQTVTQERREDSTTFAGEVSAQFSQSKTTNEPQISTKDLHARREQNVVEDGRSLVTESVPTSSESVSRLTMIVTPSEQGLPNASSLAVLTTTATTSRALQSPSPAKQEEIISFSFDSKENFGKDDDFQRLSGRRKIEHTKESVFSRVDVSGESEIESPSWNHSTSLSNVIRGKNTTEIRSLLMNLSRLEESSDISDRDYGSSYILPVLKSVNYDNSTAPTFFEDVPVNVRVLLNIVHLANFDSQLMEYTVDAEMEMRWFDLRLVNSYSKAILIREMSVLELIWRPDPYFVNAKYSTFHFVSFPNFRMRISPNGLIVYTLRVTLQPACQMTFCRFPHDRQECDIMISSIAFPQSSVRFSWHSKEAVRLLTPIALPELKMKSMLTHQCHAEGKLLRSSCLRVVFKLERDGARYIAEKYIPSTLAMMFAWVAPYVPYNYEEVRIITPITVLLTLVQMEKGENQIRTSYLTSMDTWFAAMKAFSVISLVESLAVLALIKRSRSVARQMTKAANQLEKEKLRAHQKALTQLYHRLDNGARFLSPVVFMLFFIYYVAFVAQGDEMDCIKSKSFFDFS